MAASAADLYVSCGLWPYCSDVCFMAFVWGCAQSGPRLLSDVNAAAFTASNDHNPV